MHTKEIGKKLFLVDLETGGLKNLICSYVIKGKKTILVESGPTSSVPKLLSGLKELEVKLEDIEYVAVTHVHLDHGGGAGSLLKFLPNAKVLVHPRGMPHLVNPERLWQSSQEALGFVSEIFGKPEPVPKERIIALTGGSFDLDDGGKLKVIETLGHASHNLSFHESFNGGVFPGDAAGTYFPEFDVVMPTTPPPFHLGMALESIDKIIRLKPTALYYSHFGKASDAVQRLVDYKLQLELWDRIAQDGVKKNQSLGEIRDRILVEDKVMIQLSDYLKSHRIYSRTALLNSVQGFIDYAKKKQAK
ncbi:MAG: MBL fold metallo-hydrolase [Candidatus Atribacteria bacterium]|nr:MBL fold metallo-hydrolase [Candidatus Atribacteria bacterium]